MVLFQRARGPGGPHARETYRRTGVSQLFWQQGGMGAALEAQHADRGIPVTLHVEAFAFFRGPQQGVLSQHAARLRQQSARSGWSQQYPTLPQQRPGAAQQEAAPFGAARAGTTRVTANARPWKNNFRVIEGSNLSPAGGGK